MQAASKPCSASWLLGNGLPSIVLDSDPFLLDEFAPSFPEYDFFLFEETADGIF
jgi:hypothetical protein